MSKADKGGSGAPFGSGRLFSLCEFCLVLPSFCFQVSLPPTEPRTDGLTHSTHTHAHIHPAAWRSAGLQPVFACRLSLTRAPWASGWRAGDAALSAQRRVPDGVRPRVTREVRSGCVAVSLAECLVLWFCVSLLCDRHRPSSVHPYRVGVPVVGRTVFRLPINVRLQLCDVESGRAAGGGTDVR